MFVHKRTGSHTDHNSLYIWQEHTKLLYKKEKTTGKRRKKPKTNFNFSTDKTSKTGQKKNYLERMVEICKKFSIHSYTHKTAP